MDDPKISVLIPLYNRKQYATQCIDSVLNQTFQEEYEILIRDDCSTDGVFEFIKEKYAEQISSGKIRLFQNSENVREGSNINRLFRDARGKYLQVLHNDDMLWNNALQQLYETAEKYNADVVHSIGMFNATSDSVVIDHKIRVMPIYLDKSLVKENTVISNNPLERFNQWMDSKTFQDVQYNFFRRDFIFENEIFCDENSGDPVIFSLWWVMLAKVLVKTPLFYYVRRDNPARITHSKIDANNVEQFIIHMMDQSREIDKLFHKVELFKNNEVIQYIVKAHIFSRRDKFWIFRKDTYKNGITPELYQIAVRAFKKYFGDDYFYPMFLFNSLHVMPYNVRVDAIAPPPRYNFRIGIMTPFMLLKFYLKGMTNFEIRKISHRL